MPPGCVLFCSLVLLPVLVVLTSPARSVGRAPKAQGCLCNRFPFWVQEPVQVQLLHYLNAAPALPLMQPLHYH